MEGGREPRKRVQREKEEGQGQKLATLIPQHVGGTTRAVGLLLLSFSLWEPPILKPVCGDVSANTYRVGQTT